MKRFASYIIILLTLVVPATAIAQTEQYKFKHLNINHGLTYNEISAIFKDSKGFIWIGTTSGLNRFDGYNVRSFRHDPRDTTSLNHNTISRVFETPDGEIGVVSSLGLTLYDPRRERFVRHLDDFYTRYHLTPGSLINVVKDNAGHFWFQEPSRMIRYDPVKKSLLVVQHVKGDLSSISPEQISVATTDRLGNLWIVHRNGIVEKLKSEDGKVTVAFRNDYLQKENQGQLFEYTILVDADGDVWLATLNDNQGVYYLSVRENRFSHFTSSPGKVTLNTNIVGSVVQDNQGMIWVGTDHGGVNIIDKKNFTVRYVYHRDEDEKTLSQNTIKTMYRDDLGVIWIGTYKRGVSYYHESIYLFDVFKHYSSVPQSIPFADVNRFVEDDKGNLWIGTNGGGLIYFDRLNETFRQYKHDARDPSSISSDVIVSLCIDSDKVLWVGTYYEGLNRFDGKTFKRYKHDASDTTSLSGRSVWEIFEDSKKNLWIGTLEGGVNVFNRSTGTFNRLRSGGSNAIQSTYIAAIHEDTKGNLWFGTSVGIDVLEPGTNTFTHYEYSASLENSLSNNNVLDIKEDSKGRIWIGTSEGLNLFDPTTRSFQSFGTADGLPHNTVLNILEDGQGNIWMSTPNGLSRMKFRDGRGGNPELSFNYFTEEDGLQGLQFNENAAYKTRKGELVFGGPLGFNIFDSRYLTEGKYRPRVVFTDFQIYQKSVAIGEQVNGRVILEQSVSEAKKIILPPTLNFFSIEFSALNYLHPEKNQYQYKLEGLNTEWLPVDHHTHKITFTSLNPGDYKLRVRAANDEGVWSPQEAVLSLTVLAPFWKTKTAMVLYAIFVVGILFVARKLIQQREQMKYAIQQERQEAIRMHELDMMKIKFFTNVSHEFRTPLTLILTPLEKLIRQGKDAELRSQHQLIHRNAKRLLNLVNQLLDFRKMEVQEIRFNPSEGDVVAFIRDAVYSFSDLSEKKHIVLEFRTSLTSLETIFDQDKLEKILFNLLSNAFKFTPEGGSVTVEATLETSAKTPVLRIEVKDTGIGIPADKHDKIFERFFQNDVPQSLVNQGSGIGLSITREFVRIHGGRIQVESEPGKGSCFTVFLPVKEVFRHESVVPASAPADAVVEESMAVAEDNGVETRGVRKHTLLLIEDNDDFRFYLKDNLKLLYTIIEAGNGNEGWRQTLAAQPDLIVSDIMMPEMNGIDLCRKIKSDERVSHIPVILLTARSSEEQRLEGFETGADEYISKPFNFEILESRIRNLIQQREKSHKVFRKTLDVKASELNITPLDTRFIENALKCVEENVSSPDFSVEHLGRELGISRAYLYKKILALTGKSPLEFIRTIRLQHAAQLLERSQLTVSEVAYKVGFNNPKYFTKYFKEEFNVLPSNYAASRKK
jgi:signal transduction histidine kinase/ligand-binding sensor domain-containing protein/DNA-binding response OmpR family regulator